MSHSEERARAKRLDIPGRLSRIVFFSLMLFESLLFWAFGITSWLPWLVIGATFIALFIPFWRLSDWLGKHRMTGAAVLTMAVTLIWLSCEQGWPRTSLGDPLLMSSFVANLLMVAQASIFFCCGCRRGMPLAIAVLGIFSLTSAFLQPFEYAQKAVINGMALMALIVIGITSHYAVQLGFRYKPIDLPDGEHQRWQGRRVVIHSCLFLFVATISWALIGVWETSVIWTNARAQEWLSGRDSSQRSVRSYVRSGSLTSVLQEKQIDPMYVALRVYSERTPGYLRGRVFESYRRGQWNLEPRARGKWNRIDNKEIRERTLNLPASVDPPQDGHGVFSVNPGNQGRLRKIEVHNDPLRGEMYFMPLGAAFIEGKGTFVALDSHGIIHAGIDPSSPYVVYSNSGTSLRGLLDPVVAERLLELPEKDATQIQELSDTVCQGRTSTIGRVEAIVSFFQDNFTYELIRRPTAVDQDPIVSFLLTQHPAHCEFFASGAVMLLRAQGIPCRYVTGYVATELESEYGDYWLARNRNAHAWAEAYDKERGQWITVEATPGMVIPKDESVTGADSQTEDAGEATGEANFSQTYQWLERLLRRVVPFLGRWLIWLAPLLTIVTGLYIFLTRFLGVEFDSLLLHRLLRRNVKQLSHHLRERLDRRLSRLGFTRKPGETLHQFAGRIKADSSDDGWLNECADWYLEYAVAIYAKNADLCPPPLPVSRRKR